MGAVARAGWLLQIVFKPGPMHLEFNAYETWTMLAALLRPFPLEVTIRVHSGGPESRFNRFRHAILNAIFRRTNHLILVGAHVRQVLEGAGYALPPHETVQPAFMPPPPEDEADILATYGESGRHFLESRWPLLVLQGSDAIQDDVDVYGSDLAQRGLISLLEAYPDAGLVVGRPTSGSARFRKYCDELAQEARMAGAENAIWILDGERQLWPATKRASIFLRPTTTDGDSVSLREAMHFGVPVVASDAAPRPEGTHIFRSRDQQDLNRVLARVLKEGGRACS